MIRFYNIIRFHPLSETREPMFRKTLLAATILALPLAAQAQPVRGLYVGAAAGANWHANVNTDTTINGEGFSMRTTSSVGWVALASAGWDFGNGLRAEIEGSYRSNDVDTVGVRNLQSSIGNNVVLGTPRATSPRWP